MSEESTTNDAAAGDARRPTEAASPATATSRGGGLALQAVGVFGAVVGYGSLAAFLWLVSVQTYRWFRDGEWTHFGVSDGIRVGLTRCCVKDGDSGRLASLVQWLESPMDWVGLHKVLEILPASLAVFALSILGNSLFIYCRDRREARE